MSGLFRNGAEPAILFCFAAVTRRKTTRKGGRVVECAGLEIQYTFMRIEGSNPSLSAKDFFAKSEEFKNPR
jgi:hypothetical protein